MKVYYERECKDIQSDKPGGVGLGNFDGLHIGHMKLIDTLNEHCKKRDLVSWIHTFEEHPSLILEPKNPVKLIITNEEKIDRMEKANVDFLYFGVFDHSFANMEPSEFIKTQLVEKLNARLVVTGFNYRFGKGGSGDTDYLTSQGRRYGFEVIVIPPVLLGRDVVSSTTCRMLIKNGNIPLANSMLGRKYSMSAVVTPGRKLGRKLGMPTANIIPDDKYLLPQRGVYVTDTHYKQKVYRSVTNIGVKPTVSSTDPLTIETHLIGFPGEMMYGHVIRIEFLQKIRDEMRFDHIQQLTQQVKEDIRYSLQFVRDSMYEMKGLQPRV